MSRVTRKQLSFDQELAEQNMIRTYRCDHAETATGLMPIYRETIIADDPNLFDRIPWWKLKKTSRRQKKS